MIDFVVSSIHGRKRRPGNTKEAGNARFALKCPSFPRNLPLKCVVLWVKDYARLSHALIIMWSSWRTQHQTRSKQVWEWTSDLKSHCNVYSLSGRESEADMKWESPGRVFNCLQLQAKIEVIQNDRDFARLSLSSSSRQEGSLLLPVSLSSLSFKSSIWWTFDDETAGKRDESKSKKTSHSHQ